MSTSESSPRAEYAGDALVYSVPDNELTDDATLDAMVKILLSATYAKNGGEQRHVFAPWLDESRRERGARSLCIALRSKVEITAQNAKEPSR